MLLLEIFGRKKKATGDGLTPDEREEARRSRVNSLRTTKKAIADEAPVNPSTLSMAKFKEWHGKALQDQTDYSSIGPKKGDLIMSRNGPLVVSDPNGGGDMVATVKLGDKTANINWNKLSKPVKKGDKQYYTYG
jgi:hypothetical protein